MTLKNCFNNYNLTNQKTHIITSSKFYYGCIQYYNNYTMLHLVCTYTCSLTFSMRKYDSAEDNMKVIG